MTIILSIGGVAIDWALDNQSGDYDAWIEAPFTQPSYTTIMAARDNTWPVGVLATQDAFTLPPIYTQIKNAANEAALRVALLRALDTSREFKALVIADDDGDNPRYWMCSFQAREEEHDAAGTGVVFVVTAVVTDDAYLRSVTPESDTWSATASGQTTVIDNPGDLDAFPTYTVTPTSAKTGGEWVEVRPFYVRWLSPFGGEHAIDITGGGLNTSTLHGAGKTTSRNDFGVHAAGAYRPYWMGGDDGAAGGYNTNSTQIWCNFHFHPRTTVYAVHGAASGDTSATMELSMPDNMPPSGYIYWDATNEITSYKGVSQGAWNPSVTNVGRGALGTTPGNIAAGATGEVLQVVGLLCYGPGGVVPEDEKMIDFGIEQWREPTISRSGSTNGVWKFTLFRRGDAQMFGIPGAFIAPSGPRGSINWSYTGPATTEVYTDPTTATGAPGAFYLNRNWEAMGFKSNQNLAPPPTGDSSAPKQPPRMGLYSYRFAVPLSQVRIIGRRIANGAALAYPGTPILRVYDETQQSHDTIWNAGAGAVSTKLNNTFDETVALEEYVDVLFNRLHWFISGTNHVQADIDSLDVSFDTAYRPIAALLPAITPYVMSLTLENVTTGESLTITMPDMEVDETLTINNELLTVTYSGDDSNRYSAVRRDALRPRFLRLAPGANTLRLTETGMGNIDLGISFEPRWYT
jgi:hypothetical protein